MGKVPLILWFVLIIISGVLSWILLAKTASSISALFQKCRHKIKKTAEYKDDKTKDQTTQTVMSRISDILRSLLKPLLTFAIAVASIYFFNVNNFMVGTLLLAWMLYRILGDRLNRVAKASDAINSYSDMERKTNVYLELTILIDEVLKHPSVQQLFSKLKNDKRIKQDNIDEWINTLIENYKLKYNKQNDSEESRCNEKVRFHIKNNLLWKNDKIDFNDSVYHELFIPYEYKDRAEEDTYSFEPSINSGINIRVLIVNGIIKLQIGNFSKEYTTKMISKDGIPVYQIYDTITSFPLMYFSNQHQIPENYLNVSSYATESWKKKYSDDKGNYKDYLSDWKQLVDEVRDYNFVCTLSDDYSMKEYKIFKTIIRSFEEKKDEWLKREDFKDLFAREDDDDDDMYDSSHINNIYYVNKYLAVNVVNYREFKKKREQYTYTDYYEENPF